MTERYGCVDKRLDIRFVLVYRLVMLCIVEFHSGQRKGLRGINFVLGR